MSPSQRFDFRGASLILRDIRPDDAEGLILFHLGLSPETKYRRFFSPHPCLPFDEVQRFTRVDGQDRVAKVIVHDDALIAVARYDRDAERPHEAEVAFVVDDAWQGDGLGTILLCSLVAAARGNGIGRFTAETLATNTAMLRVFRSSGFVLTMKRDHGFIHVEFPIFTG